MNPNDPWAMPPPVTVGDTDVDITFAAVGRALSSWERLEAHLSLIFSVMVGLDRESIAASRAYGTVVSFKGRAELLKAAADAYFAAHPDSTLKAVFGKITKETDRASSRRNEIAHGIVQPMGPVKDGRQMHALYPAYYATAKRELSRKPKYAYSSVEMDRFGRQFNDLCDPVVELLNALYARHPTRP